MHELYKLSFDLQQKSKDDTHLCTIDFVFSHEGHFMQVDHERIVLDSFHVYTVMPDRLLGSLANPRQNV